MSVNDTFRIINDDSRVTLQKVTSFTDDSRGVIYDCNMFIYILQSLMPKNINTFYATASHNL